jgi:catechol 2,3-dioxygenase-like lactoylglutathione lyase family enzyme
VLRFICPLIVVEDVAASRRFYEEVLGQTVAADHGENVVFEGGFAIHLKAHFRGLLGDEAVHPIGVRTHNAELYFESDELEVVQARLEQAGAGFVHRVRAQPWGQRVLRAYDPDGHLIEVGEPIGAPPISRAT